MPDILWLIVLLPLLGSVITLVFGAKSLRSSAHIPCVSAAALSAFLSVYVLFDLEAPDYRISTQPTTWFQAGGISVQATLAADTLTAVMLVAITCIGTLIAIFSIGYMHDDPGYPRYFAVVSLFLFSMSLLVLADNFLLLFAGWEGVGLCSYLLVGYWYAKPSAALAARKAFLVTRLGDAGMILGIFLLWHLFGATSLDFSKMFTVSNIEKALSSNPTLFHVACLLLFCGAVGKSAQFPLYVWLPDAMEGPTPVSALIHAATMVTAGVYLVARCMPLFVVCPNVLLTIAVIGTVTAIIAAYIALTQYDLKRVLAYSTVSQLGFMFLALGTASPKYALVAVSAAIFHLFTHAFFKATLFLSAGSVMHAMGNVIDMRSFSGLKSVLPQTHLCFLIGAAALAGLPLLSGFWSKDMILESALLASHQGSSSDGVYLMLFLVALITAAMTAFYSTRAYIKTFRGATKIPEEAGQHAHESPAVMVIPLLILGGGAALVGLILGPTGIFVDFLEKSPAIRVAADLGRVSVEHPHFSWWMALVSTVVAGVGVYLGYLFFEKSPYLADRFTASMKELYQFSYDRLYMDDIYELLFVRPMILLAFLSRGFESMIDGLTRLITYIPMAIGWAVRPIQNGLVQYYALAMIWGVAAFLGVLVLANTR